MSNQDMCARFADVISSTQCPFAKKGNLYYGSTWTPRLRLEEQVPIWAKEMVEFIRIMPSCNPDGFVVGGIGEQIPATIEKLSLFVSTVLKDFTTFDRGSPLLECEVAEHSWQFTFKGTRMFLVVMSSVYQSTNSRYSPIPESVFMFFQPEAAFDNFMPYHEHDPRTKHIKTRIRQEFVSAGKAYDVNIVTNPSEASKYIKPLNVGDPVVKWWKNL